MPRNIRALAPIFRRVRQHMLALGINKYQSKRFSGLVINWYQNSGPEWTVQRLKALKSSLVESLVTESDYKVPPGWKAKKSRKGKVIFDDYLIHTIFVQAKSNIKLALSFLKVYEVVKLRDLSETQREKMVRAIESPPTTSLDAITESISSFCVRPTTPRVIARLEEIGQSSRTLVDYMGQTKSGPCFAVESDSWKYHGSFTRQEAECFDFEDLFSYDKDISQLWRCYPTEVSRRLLGVDYYPCLIAEESYLDVPAGTLAVIQEGGCKVRWIANPILPLQVLGDPLKDKLFAYCKEFYPEIKTHDQDSGRDDVFQWLSDGRTVYSYDCTSFTDRFPLILQEHVLMMLHKEGVANEFDLAAFNLMMSKSWYFPREKRTLRWGVGQPLGYGPSFHLATISHAVILDNLDKRKDKLWRVVGDDVVIADSNLAMAYQEFMTKTCGVEINDAKSVISAEYAEFLGKFITKKSGVIPSIKVKLLDKTDQVVKTLAFYGPDSYQYMDRKQQSMALKGFLPSYVGGLGLIPRGMTYSMYVNQLNTDLLQKVALQGEVENFHRNVPHGAGSKIHDFMALKDSILKRNTKTVDLLGIAEIQQLLGSDVNLNEMTRLPTVSPIADNPHGALLSPTSWIHIQDRAWLLEGNRHFNPESTSKSLAPKRDTTPNIPLLNRWGFVDRAEKPSTLSRAELSTLSVAIDRKSNDSQYQYHHSAFYRSVWSFRKEVSNAQYEAYFGPEEDRK